MISKLFSKKYRLRTNPEFQAVFRGAKRFYSGKFTLLTKSNNLSYPRLGLSIGGKRIKRAVDRNVIKRAARERFRHQKDELGGVDIVLVVAKMPKNVNRIEVNAWLDELFKQLIDYQAS